MSILNKLMADCIENVEDISRILHLSESETEDLKAIAEKYPIRITPYYLDLIDLDDPADPIRKMSVPHAVETVAGGQEDTSGEASNTVITGMQHKYRQTALILSTNQCAMYCRHCFRKRMVGSNSNEIASHLDEMAAYVSAHTEINNVLISGGDAFMNSNEVIRRYLEHFSAIPSLSLIRFGTRIPVVLPMRVTEDQELLDLLKEYNHKKQLMIVTQFNHPKELTPQARECIMQLQKTGCLVRNQTVLLKGINDDADTLATLMNQLVANGILPYYLFQCRPVKGVHAQFQVPLLQAMDLVDRARAGMNGQAKSFRFAFSHPSGKIEVIGRVGEDRMLFKYHQVKDLRDSSRMFIDTIGKDQCWIDQVPQGPLHL